MFQNIDENTINWNNNKEKKENTKQKMFAQVFIKENIALYIVAFMLSLVSLNEEFSIFSISMLGACFASGVPLLGVIIVSLIGSLIKFGASGALGYFITSLVLIVSFFIIKPRYNESERNENIKIGKNIFIATLLTQIIQTAMAG